VNRLMRTRPQRRELGENDVESVAARFGKPSGQAGEIPANVSNGRYRSDWPACITVGKPPKGGGRDRCLLGW
jgi:hypothetical protein